MSQAGAIFAQISFNHPCCVMAKTVSPPDVSALIGQFADRLVRRSQPPPLPADYFSPPQVQARIGVALAQRGTARNQAGYRTQALLCYAFLERDEWTTAELTVFASKRATHTVSRALARLAVSGLLTWQWRSHSRFWSLTEVGGPWLLKAVKGVTAAPEGEEPPAEPGKV